MKAIDRAKESHVFARRYAFEHSVDGLSNQGIWSFVTFYAQSLCSFVRFFVRAHSWVGLNRGGVKKGLGRLLGTYFLASGPFVKQSQKHENVSGAD